MVVTQSRENAWQIQYSIGVRVTSFDWEEYLKLAEDFEDKVDDEAILRTDTSRAYYAVFHMAYDFLNKNGFTISRERNSAHYDVWDAFGRAIGVNDTWRAISKNGDELSRRRKIADYKLRKINWAESIKDSNKKARNIQQWLTDISKDGPANIVIHARTQPF